LATTGTPAGWPSLLVPSAEEWTGGAGDWSCGLLELAVAVWKSVTVAAPDPLRL
jgi:hypothetical protein